MAGEKNEKDPKDPKEPKKIDVLLGEDEDSDETWSNLPPTAKAAAEPEPADDDDDEEPEAPQPRKEIRTAKDLFLDDVLLRAKRKAPKLRAHLTGTVVTEVVPSGEKYLFDWTAEEPKIEEVRAMPTLKHAENPTAEQVDCIIRVSEQQLFQIRDGSLNPQVAMVNGKIRIEGRVGMAMYFFNVVSDR